MDLGSPLGPGYKLDRYELLCPIAQGGMAEVWMARQTGKHGFEKMVAVKTILPKYADDEGFQRMFLDEAHVSSRIEHPNVAQIFDVGEQDEITYLVMEYVDGDALSTLHKEALSHGVRIPHGVLLRLMGEVCGGLQAAHELRMADGQPAGVVHRDVSPHNILVSTKGVAKLIDFGLAKARDRMSEETSAGIVKGKLRYMAPEQVVGPRVDCRADVWAVGASLYHLLSGQPPYEADSDADVVRALMSGRPPPRLGKIVHPAVEAVVFRSLAWQMDQRYRTASEFQRALEQAARQAGLEVGVSDVSYFLAEHLGDRAAKRQEAIAYGVRAAAEREGMQPPRVSGYNLAAPSGGRLSPPPPRSRDGWTPVPPMPSVPALPPLPLLPPVRGPSAPPAPPSSASPASLSNRLLLARPSAAPPGGGSGALVAIVIGIAVLAGIGVAFRLMRASNDLPETVVSPARPSSPAKPSPRVPSAEAANAQGVPPTAGGPSAAGSSLSMTVSVSDLPVAATATARPRVYVPRPQAPRPAAPAASSEDDTPTDESSEDSTGGQ
ncbi:MAG: serine/threonine protein kinase [Polyangiaceae bacterium]